MKPSPLSQQEILDHSFLECRSKLLDIAAYLDRLDRSIIKNGESDLRNSVLKKAIQLLDESESYRTEKILMYLSDKNTQLLDERDIQNAIGASK